MCQNAVASFCHSKVVFNIKGGVGGGGAVGPHLVLHYIYIITCKIFTGVRLFDSLMTKLRCVCACVTVTCPGCCPLCLQMHVGICRTDPVQ